MRRGYWLASVLSLVAACGGRNGIPKPPEPNDASVPDLLPPTPLVVECGRREQFTTPGRPFTAYATVHGGGAVLTQGWSLSSAPNGSTAVARPTTGPATTLTTNVVGFYMLAFTVTDDLGMTARCEVALESIVGPPRAICPEGPLVAEVDETLLLEGDGFDDVAVVGYQWRIVEQPGGVAFTLSDARMPTARFVGRGAGRFVAELTVVDEEMGVDDCEVEIRVNGPPDAICDAAAVPARTRMPVTVSARAEDDGEVQASWAFDARPPGSTARLNPTTGFTTTFTPDRPGEYRLRFTVTDESGLTDSCIVLVVAAPSEPELTCPGTIDTRPLTTVEVRASLVVDGTATLRWRLTERPPGSDADDPSPMNALTTRFTPDLAGEYVLELTATDSRGETDQCITVVRALAVEGLRIEMFWDTDGTDMDTHLLHPSAPFWFHDQLDCYFGNCQIVALPWFSSGAGDDPKLDIDDVDGFGPENINVMTPPAAVFRVGIHAWRGRANRVTVRIYCGGSTTTPRMTLGPIALSSDQFWRVADVAINANGTCAITPLLRGGVPDVTTQADARTRR